MMQETRLVILTIQKEVTVDIDSDEYTYEKVWCGSRDDGYYTAESSIDEDIVREHIGEVVDTPAGWEYVDMEIEKC